MAAAAAAILLSVRLTKHGMQTEPGLPLAVCAAYVAQKY